MPAVRDPQPGVIPLWVTLLAQLPTATLLKLSPMRPCRVGKLDTSVELSWEMAPGVLAVGYAAELVQAVPALLRVPAGSLEDVHPQLSSLPFVWVWPDRKLNSHRWADLAQAIAQEDPTP